MYECINDKPRPPAKKEPTTKPSSGYLWQSKWEEEGYIFSPHFGLFEFLHRHCNFSNLKELNADLWCENLSCDYSYVKSVLCL